MFNPDFSDAVRVIDTSTSVNNTIFEVLEYKKPRNAGVFNAASVNTIPTQYGGEKLRQVRISINGGGVLVQPGELQFMKGPIQIEIQKNAPSASKGFFKNVGTGEASFTSKYYGKYGEIYLDPSYKYFYILELDNEDLILDDGMFYCCEDSIELSVHTNKNIATGLVSGDGFRQPKLSGSGIAVLESEVPFDEVLIYELNNETLKIDGNFSIVIRGKIETKIEKSKREGYLQTFQGTGEVWIAPTRKNKPMNV
ncbi:AIM24 family protein [Clostridium bowmanii]|uniref:AIM24 family protein n=1 Tax=Clostridium bowmanii TaxID=132925 RepID=UPI001C0DB158|nr:AIM24 family protein [Clostridium bowmanii]MBU3188959.1 AIM24 family protein [Clostridium bowmanii]MCA1073630.1 AIM24 family protein [Clostridium bowmanii]